MNEKSNEERNEERYKGAIDWMKLQVTLFVIERTTELTYKRMSKWTNEWKKDGM